MQSDVGELFRLRPKIWYPNVEERKVVGIDAK